MFVPRLTIPWLCLLTLPLLVAPSPAQEAPGTAAWQPRTPKVLVMVDEAAMGDARSRKEDSVELQRGVERALRQAGFATVSEAQVERLLGRARALQEHYLGDPEAQGFDQFLKGLSQADYWVQVAVKGDSEKRQQGRYVVGNAVTVKLASADAAEVLFDEDALVSANSMESYRAAHRKALEQACAVDQENSLAARLCARLDEEVREIQRAGQPLLVNVLSRIQDLEEPLLGAAELAKLPGVQQVEQQPSAPEMASFQVRYRGTVNALEDAIFAFLIEERRPLVQQKTQAELAVLRATSRRTIDLILALREPRTASLDEELKAELLKLAECLYRKNPSWYEESQLRFSPAHIPSSGSDRIGAEKFVKAYWSKYDEIARQQGEALTNPLDYQGTVKIEGVPFESLAAVKLKAEEQLRSYNNSKAGKKAQDIASIVEQCFQEVSSGKIQSVLDSESEAMVLHMIRSEAQLFEEDGAVDADSIAFFNRQGTGRMVFTRLNKVLETYRLWLTIVDVENGTKESAAVQLGPALTQRLDEALQ